MTNPSGVDLVTFSHFGLLSDGERERGREGGTDEDGDGRTDRVEIARDGQIERDRRPAAPTATRRSLASCLPANFASTSLRSCDM